MANTINPVSGQPVKHGAGTIVNAGAVTNVNNNDLSVRDAIPAELSESKVVDNSMVNPLIAGRRFAGMAAGKYVATIIGDEIAGVTDLTLRSGSSHWAGRTSFHFAKGWRRKDLASFNPFTGEATYGGNAGDLSTYIDPETGGAQPSEPEPTCAIPGKFVYTDGSPLPIQDQYQPRTNCG